MYWKHRFKEHAFQKQTWMYWTSIFHFLENIHDWPPFQFKEIFVDPQCKLQVENPYHNCGLSTTTPLVPSRYLHVTLILKLFSSIKMFSQSTSFGFVIIFRYWNLQRVFPLQGTHGFFRNKKSRLDLKTNVLSVW